jgi:hypothetical protein
MFSVWLFSFYFKNASEGKIGEIKYGLATILAETMPMLAPSQKKESHLSLFDRNLFLSRFKVGYTYGLNSVESYLSILGVQKEDYGTYTCIATAESNTRSAQIRLSGAYRRVKSPWC